MNLQFPFLGNSRFSEISDIFPNILGNSGISQQIVHTFLLGKSSVKLRYCIFSVEKSNTLESTFVTEKMRYHLHVVGQNIRQRIDK